jgi:hypothetical protein
MPGSPRRRVTVLAWVAKGGQFMATPWCIEYPASAYRVGSRTQGAGDADREQKALECMDVEPVLSTSGREPLGQRRNQGAYCNPGLTGDLRDPFLTLAEQRLPGCADITRKEP